MSFHVSGRSSSEAWRSAVVSGVVCCVISTSGSSRISQTEEERTKEALSDRR